MKVKLNELGVISTGNTPSKNVSELYDSEDIGFVKPDIISDSQINYIVKTTEYLSEAARAKARIVKKDSVFVTCIGNIGKVGIAKGNEFAFNQQINAIEPNEKIIPKYLAYSILANKKKLQAIANAPVVPIINKTQFGEFEIDITDDVDEQARIVELLDKVCSIIADRKMELEKMDELIKSRFVEMFGNENNSKRWNIVSVEEVANVQVGVVIKPSQYYTDEHNGIRAFRSLNIGEGFIKDSDWVYFTKEGNKKNSKSILKENDLLIVRSGAPGTACVVTKEYEGNNAIDIIIAHPDCEKVNPYYLCTFTNMPHGKKQIDEGIGGAAQQHFNVGKYNKLQLMLPPMELQNEFVEFIKHIDKLKSAELCYNHTMQYSYCI